ncbi:MAG: hypothetical protein ACREJ2_08050, partial [Planctomycetota bacterium]
VEPTAPTALPPESPNGGQVGGLPAFGFADLPDSALSKDGWSAPVKDGNTAYRSAKAGGLRTFDLPAWWKAGELRPPAGQHYILELHFKDTLRAPAEFYSYGAAESYLGMTLMDHFGGANDGQWKVADVPISYDLVIRLRDDPQNTRFGVKSEADLALSNARMRMSTSADEAAYEAGERAWVAWHQKALREKNPVKIQPCTLNFDRTPRFLAYPWQAIDPLMSNTVPKQQALDQPIKVRMTEDEMEGGSFGVYAVTETMTHVDYTVSPLKDAAGDELKADVIRRTAEYSLVPEGKGYTWFPVRLWPAYPADVPKGQSQWFLINLRTHRGETKPGTYKGTVTIKSDQGSSALPIEVEVLPIDLLTMDEAGLTMGGCCTGLPPQQDVIFQKEYNQNCINLWFSGAQPPMQKDGPDKLKLDFTYFDDWMENAHKNGLERVVWFLGGDPYGWPDTCTFVRDLHRIGLSGDANMQARLDWMARQDEHRDGLLPADRPLFENWVKQIYDHSTQNGWPEVILTPFDEPAKWTQHDNPNQLKGKLKGVIGTGPWIKPFFKDCCAAIHEAAPKMRVYGSIHHNKSGEGITFLDSIDVFCTNAIHEDPQLGDKVRAAGPSKTFWQYSGCGGGGAGVPSQARYTFGFFFADFDSRGSLAWAYNWGPGLDTTEGGANWEYAYITPYGTVPAPYFEGMREGWDDRRIVETFKKKFADDPAAMAKLKSILDEAAGRRTEGGRDTVNSFWAGIDDPKKLDVWKNELLDMLAKK